MTRITYEIGGSVRSPDPRLSPFAHIGENRPVVNIGLMRPAYPESGSYPEVAHHG